MVSWSPCGAVSMVLTKLGKMKKLKVKKFQGKTLVDIREYYKPKGSEDELPGKKVSAVELTMRMH